MCYAYGLRAVISHVMESGEEKPLIAFTSWTLTASECNYSQIEKRRCPLCSYGEEVSFIPLWPQVYVANKSQALIHYFWSEDRGASIGNSQIAKIGP